MAITQRNQYHVDKLIIRLNAVTHTQDHTNVNPITAVEIIAGFMQSCDIGSSVGDGCYTASNILALSNITRQTSTILRSSAIPQR